MTVSGRRCRSATPTACSTLTPPRNIRTPGHGTAVQEEHLQKLLNQPDLNYVALNRAAAKDPYAFIRASTSAAGSIDSEIILTTALSRGPATLMPSATLAGTDSHSDALQQRDSAHELPHTVLTSAAFKPHMSYNVAKLLEQTDRSAGAPKHHVNVLARTHASPGCGGSPTALYDSVRRCLARAALPGLNLGECVRAGMRSKQLWRSVPQSTRSTWSRYAASTWSC